MPQSGPPLRTHRLKAGIALLLTFVAGFVDITGALTIYNIFAAHMTGTTVRIGKELLQQHWYAATLAASVLAAFVLGSLAGRILVEVASRKKFRNIASLIVSLEAALLMAVIWSAPAILPWTGKAAYPLMAMLALAMGLQTATLTRIGPLTVHTTFVTGMINKFCQLASHWIFRTYDLIYATGPQGAMLRQNRSRTGRQALFIGSIWVLYLAGACCGTWLSARWRLHAFFVPFALLVIIVAVDLIHPLSIEEEREQPER